MQSGIRSWLVRTTFAALTAACSVSISGPSYAGVNDFERLRELRLQRHAGLHAHIHARNHRRIERRRSVAAVVPTGLWSANSGSDLKTVLGSWCARQGWQLVWRSDFAYELTSGAEFSGTFEDAVRALILSMHDVRPMPTVNLFEGNKVVVVGNAGDDGVQ